MSYDLLGEVGLFLGTHFFLICEAEPVVTSVKEDQIEDNLRSLGIP